MKRCKEKKCHKIFGTFSWFLNLGWKLNANGLDANESRLAHPNGFILNFVSVTGKTEKRRQTRHFKFRFAFEKHQSLY